MRIAGWYALFVGLPVAGLFGILRLGERLVPPPAVHGSYAVALDPGAATGPCLAPLLADPRSSLTISQYGPRIEIRVGPEGRVVLRGTVIDSTLGAAGPLPRDVATRPAECRPGDTVSLTARLERIGTGRRLAGELALRGCGECPALPFHATRARPRVATGHP